MRRHFVFSLLLSGALAVMIPAAAFPARTERGQSCHLGMVSPRPSSARENASSRNGDGDPGS